MVLTVVDYEQVGLVPPPRKTDRNTIHKLKLWFGLNVTCASMTHQTHIVNGRKQVFFIKRSLQELFYDMFILYFENTINM